MGKSTWYCPLLKRSGVLSELKIKRLHLYSNKYIIIILFIRNMMLEYEYIYYNAYETGNPIICVD